MVAFSAPFFALDCNDDLAFASRSCLFFSASFAKRGILMCATISSAEAEKRWPSRYRLLSIKLMKTSQRSSAETGPSPCFAGDLACRPVGRRGHQIVLEICDRVAFEPVNEGLFGDALTSKQNDDMK
ncbi:hypothetical protein L596_020530 [Steinernema carpocapsae]|uniref:Uncharacterized protein n=1 Tax=Steinernema carpocapsae TaxID=34508 RepID=A0A4U5MTW3_STECR|nr:hypothetical protein L596_020530 [Steinernema carpocapsae]